MAVKKGPLLQLLAGAALLALGACLLVRAVFFEKSISADIPPSLSGFAAIVVIMGGLWLSGAQNLLGRRAPAFEWTAFWGGGFSMAVGTFLMAASVLDPRDEAFHGPRWLLTLAGVIFVLFGAHALRRGAGAAREGDTAGVLLMLSIFTSFGAICSWVAFGPGKREFEGGISIPFLSLGFDSGEVMGRIAFGIVAVLLDVIALAGWGAAAVGLGKWFVGRFRGKRPEPPHPPPSTG